ncbi:MAG: septal ring lytic transglycosylase RlpA family protein [Nitrospira sp.]|nr:septal ring lytic transglycosylase RlpA family protein [bacterium]MBL7049473.1 septal ring lytic transglycosylase RlpA family protein [Nitrospira sp.]
MSQKTIAKQLLKPALTIIALITLLSCSTITAPYRATKTIVKGTIQTVKGVAKTVKGAYELTAGTTRLVYSVGEFTFNVVRAPLDWPLMNNDIETIDGLPVKEAIRTGRVKNAPYTVKGKRYYPMSVAKAQTYKETGIASWYGHETLRQKDGHMTANGEKFSPYALTAAHKHLPLPMNVKVTNLSNGRSIVVRVNDRGPFPSSHNPSSGKRIIDLSMKAAKKLGFYDKGTARVKVEVIS